MIRSFWTTSRESFGLKVLISFIAVIVVVLALFTVFAADNESKKAKEGLREQGEMLSDLLAHAAVTGVFAENEKMVANVAEGAVDLKGVAEVTIFNAAMKVLYSSTGKASFIADRMNRTGRDPMKSLSIVETNDSFEFLRPVLIASAPVVDEAVYFGRAPQAKADKVIGYVGIVLSKRSYHKEMQLLLARNAFILLVLIAASVVTGHFAIRRVTRPLKNLTEGVKALGLGMHVEQVPVETRDELGNLASTFNAMLVAREQAEQEIRKYHERLTAMSSDLSLVEERERRSIATNLHDTIGQLLAVSKIKLGLLGKSEETGRLSEELEEVREMIGQCIQYTRTLTFELSPPVLYELGLEAALDMLGSQFGQRHSLDIRVEKNGTAGQALSDEVRVLLFKTVRELLMNIVKHANAHTVKISIHNEAEIVRITVEDDGKGFDVEKSGLYSGAAGGFGLFSVRERLRYLNGQFVVDSAPSRGTRVVITAPRMCCDKEAGEV